MRKIVLFLSLVLITFSCSKKMPDDALVSFKTKSPPVLDGMVDSEWDNAKAFTVSTKVPPYSEFDEFYHNQKFDVSMKSLYTDEDVYFLFSWTGDDEISYERETWYFNSSKGYWMQKPKKNSDEYSLPVYEDKFAVLWNINNSIDKFNQAGCLVLCHGKYKHTNQEGELGDMWHWKLDRTGPVNQLDDKWLTYSDKNGRKSDEGSGAYKTNKQELVDKDGNLLAVPLYWIPETENYYWIMDGDESAKKIVSIDNSYDLIDEDGAVIPRDVSIPSLYGIQPATGSRGDVEVYHNYEDGVWNLEVKRKRTTGNSDDIDLSDSKGLYFFSIAAFNKAAIAHAIPEPSGNSYQFIFK